jgi:hypothetical protein
MSQRLYFQHWNRSGIFLQFLFFDFSLNKRNSKKRVLDILPLENQHGSSFIGDVIKKIFGIAIIDSGREKTFS